MTPAEVKRMIDAVGIPAAYHQFAENTGQQPPFICFFYGPSSDLAADNTNYVRIEQLIIELYTDTKDFDLESRLESVLNQNEYVFAKSETFLDGEHMHETIYTTNVYLEV